MQFFDQNYGLTSLEKIQKFDYIWSAYFYSLETILFYRSMSKNYFKIIFAQKQRWNNCHFLTKIMG